MRSELSSKDFSHAMNCIYLIEEINALCLDEGRKPTQEEKDAILFELDVLDKVFTSNSK